MKKINLNVIRIDGGTQARVEIDMGVVAEYADAVKAGVDFPSITVYHDGADYWLADGFHRFHAHKQAGKASIAAEVLSGTVREAILHSLGANGTHGLRRSNADKRQAVLTMLDDAEWAEWSDRKIAEACGVSQPFVSGLRKPEKVITVITPELEKVSTVDTPSAEKVITVITPERFAPAPADYEMAEAVLTINELATENEQLRDRLAVEAMDASEEEKTAAAETIAELRQQIKTLEAELAATRASRDGFQRQNSELMKQVQMHQRQLKKAA